MMKIDLMKKTIITVLCLLVCVAALIPATDAYAYTLKLPTAVIRDIMDRKEKGLSVEPAEDIIVQNPDLTRERNCHEGVIILGDSRTCYMARFMGINDNIENYAAISCGGEGYGFLAGMAIPEAEKLEALYPDTCWKYVIASGLNDMERVRDYGKLYRKLLADGKDVYFMSINPIEEDKDMGFGYKNSTIVDFNRYMRKIVPQARYIDSYKNVRFVTVDGVHNDEATSRKLFEYIQKTVGVPAQNR